MHHCQTTLHLQDQQAPVSIAVTSTVTPETSSTISVKPEPVHDTVFSTHSVAPVQKPEEETSRRASTSADSSLVAQASIELTTSKVSDKAAVTAVAGLSPSVNDEKLTKLVANEPSKNHGDSGEKPKECGSKEEPDTLSQPSMPADKVEIHTSVSDPVVSVEHSYVKASDNAQESELQNKVPPPSRELSRSISASSDGLIHGVGLTPPPDATASFSSSSLDDDVVVSNVVEVGKVTEAVKAEAKPAKADSDKATNATEKIKTPEYTKSEPKLDQAVEMEVSPDLKSSQAGAEPMATSQQVSDQVEPSKVKDQKDPETNAAAKYRSPSPTAVSRQEKDDKLDKDHEISVTLTLPTQDTASATTTAASTDTSRSSDMVADYLPQTAASAKPVPPEQIETPTSTGSEATTAKCTSQAPTSEDAPITVPTATAEAFVPTESCTPSRDNVNPPVIEDKSKSFSGV